MTKGIASEMFPLPAGAFWSSELFGWDREGQDPHRHWRCGVCTAKVPQVHPMLYDGGLLVSLCSRECEDAYLRENGAGPFLHTRRSLGGQVPSESEDAYVGR